MISRSRSSRSWRRAFSGHMNICPGTAACCQHWRLGEWKSLLFFLLIFVASFALYTLRSTLFVRECVPDYVTAHEAGERPSIAIVTFEDTRKVHLSSEIASLLDIEVPASPVGIMTATWHNKCEYARKYGYSLLDATSRINHKRPHAWSKMRIAIESMKMYLNPTRSNASFSDEDLQCYVDTSRSDHKLQSRGTKSTHFDWILYLDADTIVTNYGIRLEALIPSSAEAIDLVFPRDMYGLNSGVWLARNTQWSRQFLREWSRMDGFVRGNETTKSGDNAGLLELLRLKTPKRTHGHVTLVPQCSMNSYIWRWSFKQIFRVLQSPVFMYQGLWQQGDFMLHMAGFTNKFMALEEISGKWEQP